MRACAGDVGSGHCRAVEPLKASTWCGVADSAGAEVVVGGTVIFSGFERCKLAAHGLGVAGRRSVQGRRMADVQQVKSGWACAGASCVRYDVACGGRQRTGPGYFVVSSPLGPTTTTPQMFTTAVTGGHEPAAAAEHQRRHQHPQQQQQQPTKPAKEFPSLAPLATSLTPASPSGSSRNGATGPMKQPLPPQQQQQQAVKPPACGPGSGAKGAIAAAAGVW